MKKLIVLSAIVAFTATMFSCKKDYECVLPSGTVYSSCTDCSGPVKTTFETNCSLVGGTVQEK